jgi:hypothetical protein
VYHLVERVSGAPSLGSLYHFVEGVSRADTLFSLSVPAVRLLLCDFAVFVQDRAEVECNAVIVLYNVLCLLDASNA